MSWTPGLDWSKSRRELSALGVSAAPAGTAQPSIATTSSSAGGRWAAERACSSPLVQAPASVPRIAPCQPRRPVPPMRSPDAARHSPYPGGFLGGALQALGAVSGLRGDYPAPAYSPHRG